MTLEAPSPAPATDDTLALVQAIADAADDRKAGDIRILRVDEVAYLTDYFVFCTGFSPVQVRAIAKSIEAKTGEVFGRDPLRMEGLEECRWVLLDYGDVIVHVFLPQEREFYNLEAFWSHGQPVPITPSTPA